MLFFDEVSDFKMPDLRKLEFRIRLYVIHSHYNTDTDWSIAWALIGRLRRWEECRAL